MAKNTAVCKLLFLIIFGIALIWVAILTRHFAIELEPHLVQSVTLFRHGDRTSEDWFRFQGELKWGLEEGKLTRKGIVQAFNFGRVLRSRYKRLVKGDLTAKQLFVRSSHYDRTEDSATGVLLGFLLPDHVYTEPAKGDCQCRNKVGGRSSSASCLASCIGLVAPAEGFFYQQVPKPIVKDKKEDKVLRQTHACGDYSQKYCHIEPNISAKGFKEFSEVIEFVKDTYGEDQGNETVLRLGHPDKPTDPDKFYHLSDPSCAMRALSKLHDAIKTVASHQLKYPPADISNDDLLDMVNPFKEWDWRSRYQSSLGPYVAGILMAKIFEGINLAVANHHPSSISPFSSPIKPQTNPHPQSDYSDKPFVFLSAHDSTIISLLSDLMVVHNASIPQYCSHIQIEVWHTPRARYSSWQDAAKDLLEKHGFKHPAGQRNAEERLIASKPTSQTSGSVQELELTRPARQSRLSRKLLHTSMAAPPAKVSQSYDQHGWVILPWPEVGSKLGRLAGSTEDEYTVLISHNGQSLHGVPGCPEGVCRLSSFQDAMKAQGRLLDDSSCSEEFVHCKCHPSE